MPPAQPRMQPGLEQGGIRCTCGWQAPFSVEHSSIMITVANALLNEVRRLVR